MEFLVHGVGAYLRMSEKGEPAWLLQTMEGFTALDDAHAEEMDVAFDEMNKEKVA